MSTKKNNETLTSTLEVTNNRFKSLYHQQPSGDQVINDGQIVTRPGQSLTIEETIVRFGQNGTLRQNNGYQYYDDVIGTDTSKLSFEELHDYSQKVAQHAAKLSMAAQDKMHKQRQEAIDKQVQEKFEAYKAQNQVANPPA